MDGESFPWIVRIKKAKCMWQKLRQRAQELELFEREKNVKPIVTESRGWLHRMELPASIYAEPDATAIFLPLPLTNTIVMQEVDELQQPVWLLEAQKDYFTNLYKFRDEIYKLTNLAMSEAPATLAKQMQNLDIRTNVEISIDELHHSFIEKDSSMFTATDLWKHAATEEVICTRLTEEAIPHAFDALSNDVIKGSVYARIYVRTMIAAGQQGKAISSLRVYCDCKPYDIEQKLELFALLMANNDAETAHQIFANGHTDAARVATELWGGRGPLPLYLHTTLHRLFCEDINEVTNFVAQIKVEYSLKQMLWLSAMELHLGSERARTAQNRQTLQMFDCVVCFDECIPNQDAALVNCRCANKICISCAAGAVQQAESSGIIDCCSIGCGATLTRQDLERLGLNPSDVKTRLIRIIGKLIEHIEKWMVCTTPDCIGGCQVLDTSKYVFVCGLCGEANRTVEEYDLNLARQLLEGILGIGVYSECSGCGIPIEKNGGCNHMTCRKCKCEWHIGKFRPPPTVPGLLGRIGFYSNINGNDENAVKMRARQWLDSLNTVS